MLEMHQLVNENILNQLVMTAESGNLNPKHDSRTANVLAFSSRFVINVSALSLVIRCFPAQLYSSLICFLIASILFSCVSVFHIV